MGENSLWSLINNTINTLTTATATTTITIDNNTINNYNTAVDTNLYTSLQFSNFTEAIAARLSSASSLALLSAHQNQNGHHQNTINSTGTFVHNLTDAIYNNLQLNNSATADVTATWDWWFFLLASLYFIVVFGGVFGNASLIITLYTQSSARLRNPLLVAVCAADLFVSGIAAPVSIVTLAMLLQQKSAWTIPSTLACKSTHFLQVSADFVWFH